MQNQLEANDTRPVHVKVVATPMGPRFCTVLPPSLPEENDLVWGMYRNFVPSQTSHALPFIDGPTLVGDYIQTRIDNEA